jgi:hypothetical protein
MGKTKPFVRFVELKQQIKREKGVTYAKRSYVQNERAMPQ